MAKKNREKTEDITSEEKSDQDTASDPAPEAGEIISMKEAIEMLNTTRSTFYRWLREGKIKGMKVGRQWRFYREDIARFLKGQEPRIDLPADIGPLIENLRERAGKHDATDAPPVVEVVNLMMLLASKMNASDIHLATHTKGIGEEAIASLRYRVDGVLYTIAEIDTRLFPAILSRWKILSACDVVEKNKPQDGRIMARLSAAGEELDMRVSFVPGALGESLTVRIIGADRSAHLQLDKIDFSPGDRDRILRWIEAPWGMIVISGPAGSGKTTILYACLNHISRPEIKIMTAENPVEVLLPWAVQVPVQPNAGFTFSAALRSIMRSDPDVIMVGEIRDHETLAVAHECAVTGHLVITTMHSNDSIGTLKRLVDMGSDPYIIGESVKLIISLRLVRILCPDCSVEKSPPAELLDEVAEVARRGGLDWDSLPKKFRERVGCEKCKETGYRGRNIVAETLEVTPEVIAALGHGASIDEMRAIAVEQGMTTITADGIRRAALGETSLGEVMRVLKME